MSIKAYNINIHEYQMNRPLNNLSDICIVKPKNTGKFILTCFHIALRFIVLTLA